MLFAPAASPLAKSPEKRTPPSDITGIPLFLSAFATFVTAETCGIPTPLTIRVVQIEPGPIPTFTASAPALTSASAASAVAILPPITCVSLKFFFIHLTISNTPFE